MTAKVVISGAALLPSLGKVDLDALNTGFEDLNRLATLLSKLVGFFPPEHIAEDMEMALEVFAQAMIWRGDDEGHYYAGECVSAAYARECFERAFSRTAFSSEHLARARERFEEGLTILLKKAPLRLKPADPQEVASWIAIWRQFDDDAWEETVRDYLAGLEDQRELALHVLFFGDSRGRYKDGKVVDVGYGRDCLQTATERGYITSPQVIADFSTGLEELLVQSE